MTNETNSITSPEYIVTRAYKSDNLVWRGWRVEAVRGAETFTVEGTLERVFESIAAGERNGTAQISVDSHLGRRDRYTLQRNGTSWKADRQIEEAL